MTNSDGLANAKGTTYFAPAEVATAEELTRWAAAVTMHPLMSSVLDTLGGVATLLNPQRQIVAVNHKLLESLGAADAKEVLGLRPGEALGCVKVEEAPSGCGTGRTCATCGAAIAIVSAQEANTPIERECLLTVRRNGRDESLEFLARARRLAIDELPFTMVLLHDIRDQKRKETLERTFFHDILNTVGSLRSYSELLAMVGGHEREELIHEMDGLLDRVVREVQSHRDLALAEQGEYRVNPAKVQPSSVLREVEVAFLHSDIAFGKTLSFACSASDVITDRTVLLRVLTNMVKNALEATATGGTVRVWSENRDERVSFHVHNDSAINDTIAHRIFQRSFTTKHGVGRGMGTYSMKLFGEECLRGQVSFTTSRDEGTTFTLTIPRAIG